MKNHIVVSVIIGMAWACVPAADGLSDPSCVQEVYPGLSNGALTYARLATLPDGVLLENLEFRLKDDKGLLDITATARLSNNIGESMLLSRVMAMLDQSPTLSNHRDPSITVVPMEKERYLKITVTSEVSPLDETK